MQGVEGAAGDGKSKARDDGPARAGMRYYLSGRLHSILRFLDIISHVPADGPHYGTESKGPDSTLVAGIAPVGNEVTACPTGL